MRCIYEVVEIYAFHFYCEEKENWGKTVVVEEGWIMDGTSGGSHYDLCSTQ